MSRDETFKILSIIKATYRNSGIETKGTAEMEQTLNAWAVMLEDIPYAVAVQAVRMHASVSPFPPTIAEIRQRAVQLTHPESNLTPDEVWEKTVAAVRRFGRCRMEQGLQTLPADVRGYARRWFIEICNSENLDVIRGQFIKNYTVTAERDREMKQFPAAIQNILQKGAAALALPDA